MLPLSPALEITLYLLLLAVAWAVVLLPPVIQRLVVSRPSSTGRDPLAALARRHQAAPLHAAVEVGPAQPDAYTPSSADAAQQRRRLVASVLGVVALVTLFLVPVLGAPMLVLHLGIDAVLVGFGYLWWQRNQALDQATASVVALSSLRHAAARQPTPTPTGELPRVVNG